MTLGVGYSAHRDDNDARDDEKYANPGEWLHEVSEFGVTYGADGRTSVQVALI
jgi:hypothetical protein